MELSILPELQRRALLREKLRAFLLSILPELQRGSRGISGDRSSLAELLSILPELQRGKPKGRVGGMVLFQFFLSCSAS